MEPEKLNKLFLQHLTPTRRMDFIIERVRDIEDLLGEMNYAIVNGIEAED